MKQLHTVAVPTPNRMQFSITQSVISLYSSLKEDYYEITHPSTNSKYATSMVATALCYAWAW
jgi:hypothetical protein